MRTEFRRLAVIFAGVLLCACEADFEPPDRAVRVEAAANRFESMEFDTVRWENQDERLLHGNIVYAEQCRRCHGPMGLGETDYARSRNLFVPPLVGPGAKPYDIPSLRRMIYTGHEVGMPIFGESPLVPRDIDAAAAYLRLTLRPEMDGRG